MSAANLKWPVGYGHCMKHPHYSGSFYVATQSVVIPQVILYVSSKSHPESLRSSRSV